MTLESLGDFRGVGGLGTLRYYCSSHLSLQKSHSAYDTKVNKRLQKKTQVTHWYTWE